MDGEVPENGKEKSGSVSHDLSPRRSTKTLRAMKAPYSVKRITFNPSEANPGDRLEVRVSGEVWGNDLGRHRGLRRIQDLD